MHASCGVAQHIVDTIYVSLLKEIYTNPGNTGRAGKSSLLLFSQELLEIASTPISSL